jgi:hypothetical protein
MISHLLNATANKRSGTTLTEVLMSMMILSIGVLSLASLFPIGILSSVRATQLTHAVTLKHNVANRIDLDPGLILDPDRNYNQLTGTNLRYIVDPLGSVRLADLNGNGVIDCGEDLNGNGFLDPGEDQNNNGQLDNDEVVPYFGNIVSRWHAGYRSLSRAENLVALPDSWTELATGAPEAFPNTPGPDMKKVRGVQSMDLTAAKSIAMANLQQGPQVPLRIMLVDQRNGQSHSSRIKSVVGQVIEWDRALPMAAAANIDEIRVQQQDLKYTCLFTVRREGNGTASVDVVVFLRRSFILDDERPVHCSRFEQGKQTITVTNVPVDMSVRPGGYVLDTHNLRWYQIASVTETTVNSIVFFLIELQQTIVENAPEVEPNPPNQLCPGNLWARPNAAILMPDVVQVFQLGDR